MARCPYCLSEFTIEDKIFRKDQCSNCRGDLHVCLMCRFYEVGRNNDCREERAERQVIKDRSNFCDYFEAGEGGGPADKVDDAKKTLDDLFK